MKPLINEDYKNLLFELKIKIKSTQLQSIRTLNSSLILLYFEIGNLLIKHLSEKNWGSKVTETLSKDLCLEFPHMKGFSIRNLQYMRHFAETWKESAIVQQVVAQLPWGHNITLLTKLSNNSDMLWYANKCLESGWSRSILSTQIESDLQNRIANVDKINNFDKTLDLNQSDLVISTFKDPYIFDFLSLGQNAQEREIENALVNHIQKFLLELGAGFAFIGRQVHLEIAQQDYYLDLLFYHTRLHCYVVIELKAGDFKPEYVGKLNFYLSAVDDKLKSSLDQPTIGILLCKTKNKIIAEYALKNMTKPMGIAEFKIGDSIPEKIKTELPTIEDIEEELNKK